MVNCRNCIKDKKCSKPFENEDDLQMQYHGRVFADEKAWFEYGDCDYFEGANFFQEGSDE